MNEVMIFNNPEFGEVRTVTINGEPWFVGKDVAAALGYEKERGAIQSHVDSDDALKWGITDSMGRVQDTTVINESGLYSLIFGSKLDSAKRFKKWVTGEVLPQIRKTGSYNFVAQPSYQIENPAERARAWAKEYEEKQRLEQKNREQADKIEADKPKVSYYNQCVDRKVNSNFRNTAKELNMSQTQLTGWLLDMKYIYKDSKGLLYPYEPFVKAGFFVIKDYVNAWSGYSGQQTMVTPEGKAHLQLLIENDGANPRSKSKHGGRKRK